MKNIEHAKKMLKMAKKDLKALRAMKDNQIDFADEIYGFHAQQSVEKSLKAWLDIHQIEYKKVPDLNELFNLIKQCGEQIADEFLELTNLTDFAVDYRYEPLEDEPILDERNKIYSAILNLIAIVESKIDEKEMRQ